jgi:uncharacterized protein
MDRMKRVPLHYAALVDNTGLVESLLVSGADPDIADVQGLTPLRIAAQEYSVASARLLLIAGADVNAVNLWGNGPLFVAVFNSCGRGSMMRA